MDSYTLKQLLQATEGHEYLPERALKLARQTEEHAYGISDRGNLLKSMANSVTRLLPRNSSIPALIQVELLKNLYGKDGPLTGYLFPVDNVNHNNAPFIAAMYYLAHTSLFLDFLLKPKIQKAIAEIAFAQGPRWDALRPTLESLDGLKRSYQLLESVPDLLANLHKHFQHDRDAVFLQRFGGVERVKSVGGDLDAICKSVMKSLEVTRLAPQNLLLVHKFLMEANHDLLASGQITKMESKERHGKVLLQTLCSSARKPQDPAGCYHKILTELAPLMGKVHGSDLIPRLTEHMSVQEIAAAFKDPLSVIDPEKFKTRLNKYVDVGTRYDLVAALGVKEIFTLSEINKLKGEKLESALGL
jgi:hypothetical protein